MDKNQEDDELDMWPVLRACLVFGLFFAVYLAAVIYIEKSGYSELWIFVPLFLLLIAMGLLGFFSERFPSVSGVAIGSLASGAMIYADGAFAAAAEVTGVSTTWLMLIYGVGMLIVAILVSAKDQIRRKRSG